MRLPLIGVNVYAVLGIVLLLLEPASNEKCIVSAQTINFKTYPVTDASQSQCYGTLSTNSILCTLDLPLGQDAAHKRKNIATIKTRPYPISRGPDVDPERL